MFQIRADLTELRINVMTALKWINFYFKSSNEQFVFHLSTSYVISYVYLLCIYATTSTYLLHFYFYLFTLLLITMQLYFFD